MLIFCLVVKGAQSGRILTLSAGLKGEEMLEVGDFLSLRLIVSNLLLDRQPRLAPVSITSILWVSECFGSFMDDLRRLI
jgi:hypothetical protein